MKSFAGPKKVITAQSMGATITSSPINIQLMDDVGLQAVVTAGTSPVGVLSVQVSADHLEDNSGNVLVAGNWSTVQSPPGTDLTLAVAANGAYYFDLSLLSAPFCRLVYTRTSGTGTLNAFMVAKSLS